MKCFVVFKTWRNIFPSWVFLVFIYSVFYSGDIVKKLLKVGNLEKKDKNGDGLSVESGLKPYAYFAFVLALNGVAMVQDAFWACLAKTENAETGMLNFEAVSFMKPT